MNIKSSILVYIRYKKLNWYGHVERMHEVRLNGVHLEKEEMVYLGICGWRK